MKHRWFLFLNYSNNLLENSFFSLYVCDANLTSKKNLVKYKYLRYSYCF